jgi:sulfofructose kinase
VSGRVVCVGIAVIDYVLEIEAFPPTPVKMSALSRSLRGGGPAATGAVACAALGTPVEYWGPLGPDDEGQRLRRMLADHGVGMQALVDTDQPTMVAMVLVDRRGERLIVGHGSAGMRGPVGPLPLARLDHAAVVLADCARPQATMDVLVAARERGVPGVLDAEEIHPDRLLPLAQAATLPVFSEGAAALLCGGLPTPGTLGSLRDLLPGDFGVTLGARGSIWRIGDSYREFPALAVSCVDSTGAGDVFHGALAAGMAEGMPTERTIRLATAAAGLKCAAGNGWDGMPNRREVEAAMTRL